MVTTATRRWATVTDGDATAAASGLDLSPRTYRFLDRATKLGGVGLVALGLDAGGDTLVGLALGVLGAAVALTTVFLRQR
jgi:hypothetical protein